MEHKNNKPNIDLFAANLAEWVIRWRWLAIFASLLLAVVAGSGGRFLEFATNYRAFFSPGNPELLAFEEFQKVYTKNDNFLFVIQPRDGQVFSPEVAAVMESMTAEAWKIPYAIRVDSLTNFQHTWSEEDDLTVEDLIKNGAQLSEEVLVEKRSVALAEPLLRNNLISVDAQTAGINVVLQYPEKDLTEVPEAAAYARQIVADVEAEHPDITLALTGVSMMNNTFAESGMKDMATLVPIMYLTLLLMMVFTLRTVSGTATTLLVILFSSITAMGIAGFMRIGLTPISMTAPTIILTLAIADSVHIILSMLAAVREGLAKRDAIVEAVRINFLPVSITSLTTIIGFMTLNFSDSPPFNHLGTITAIGIAAAWLFSIFLLPALMSVLPFHHKETSEAQKTQRSGIDRLADFVIRRYRGIIGILGIVAVFFIAMVPRIDLNDEWTKYFSKRIEFRQDTDFALANLGGLYPMEYSVRAEGPDGISDPAFLAKLDEFAVWLGQQPEVTHVYSLTDIMKRLNKNMHGDDPSYYRLPEDKELAAQYLLLYELSLPYGLDLNDRINIDKSATRLTATLGGVSTVETRAFIDRSVQWLKDNAPEHMWTQPTGANVMFSYIAKRNIESMLWGNVIAVVAISLIMMVALRSLRFGALSLIPNALPILITFGLWAVLVGMVGMAAATVTATSLGIIVDDTVHFLTKYLRGIREKHLTVPDAIRYSFRTVGKAMLVNSIILAMGFAVLAFSTFKINAEMGLLTALAVVVALIFDFLMLPALLMLGNGWKTSQADAPKI